MKSLFRFLSLGALAMVFTAGSVTNSFAQDVCADTAAVEAAYKKFQDTFAGTTIEMQKTAIDSAKQYIEKYAACADFKPQVDYLNGYVPTAEKRLEGMVYQDMKQKLFQRFNAGMKAKNWDEVYASGKDIVAKVTDDPTTVLDVTIVLGSIGFDEAVKNNDKYNADTTKYAQEAIKKIEGGQTSKAYGVVAGEAKYAYGTKDAALGYLTYYIGYLAYNRGTKDKKAAVPYLFKATQYNSGVKKSPDAYQGIGSFYLDEILALETKRQDLLKTLNNVDNAETKAIFAMQKGYADRAMEVYAKAYDAIDSKTEKARKDAVYTNIKFLYELRNGKPDGLNPSYISGLAAKPLVNPATEVIPVVEAPPVEKPTDTTGTTKPSTATTTPATTKPAATTTAKPTTTKPATTKPATTKPAASTTTATKTPAKKPAPKKKGTR